MLGEDWHISGLGLGSPSARRLNPRLYRDPTCETQTLPRLWTHQPAIKDGLPGVWWLHAGYEAQSERKGAKWA